MLPAWVIFIAGVTCGFLIASFLIGWYAKENEEDRKRLEKELERLRRIMLHTSKVIVK